jgi:hypothetical protein
MNETAASDGRRFLSDKRARRAKFDLSVGEAGRMIIRFGRFSLT